MVRKSKYNNRKAYAFGRTFDSVGERDRAFYLTEAVSQGVIRELRFQTPFRLSVNGVHICKYIADFVYEKKDSRGNWHEIVEDFKGFETPVFKLKNKLMKACHNIEVRIVKIPSLHV